MSLDEYFGTADAPVGPPFERPVYDAVRSHLDALDAAGDSEPIHVEPVSVGLFCKYGSRTFLQLRPMTKWVAAGFVLHRKLDHPRLARKVVGEGSRWYHVVNLRGPEDVDDLVRGWITEAYEAAEI